MAPPNGVSRARNAPVNRPVSGRSVVPAIPLPYVRRANHAKQSTKDAQPQPIVNGSSLKIQQNAEPATPETVVTEIDKTPEVKAEVDSSPVISNGIPSDAPAAQPTPPATESDATETTEETPEPIISQTAEEPDLGELTDASEQPAQDPPQSIPQRPAATVVPPPAVPASRYTMPPPFQPTGRPVNPLTNGDLARGPRHGINGPAHLHHPRPSSGSLQFGGFGSNNSSPAPPHSAGFGPPPGLPGPHDGRRPFQGHGHNPSGHGFPPMMPYGTEFVPVTSPENYGPHPTTAPGEPFHFPGSNYGPATPLSYQGSNSPNQPDDSGAFGNFRPPHGPNGVGGHHDEHHRHHGSRGFNGPPPQRMMGGPMPPPHVMHAMQEAQSSEPWSEYLQSQFQDKSFADCNLELRYLDGRDTPVQLRGHRLVLARSQPIRAILQGRHESDPTIVLETNDKYLRSGPFWMAVQRMYGFPLLDGPDPHTMGDGNMALAGGLDVRFDFALGYAAAGKLLEWPSVVLRGIEIAAHHLSWNTLEKALEFALGDVPGRASADQHAQFAYGKPVQILIDAIISFIIAQFPPFFRLDTSVADPEAVSRIPLIAATPPAQMEPQTPAARNGKVQFSQGHRARPTHIKFGDMSTPSPPLAGNGYESHQLSAQEQAINTTLSKILLNLPFAFFKPILEYAEPRFQSIRPVVAEREARRLRAVEAVIEGRVPEAAEIRQALRSVEPRHTGDAWHILGWQEEVVTYHGEGPSLGRQWVPFSGPGSSPHADAEAIQPAYP